MRLKPTKPDERRFIRQRMCGGTLSDGTRFEISAEYGEQGGVVVQLGAEAYLLPYGALLKAAEGVRRG